jgi:hypothetical protein
MHVIARQTDTNFSPNALFCVPSRLGLATSLEGYLLRFYGSFNGRDWRSDGERQQRARVNLEMELLNCVCCGDGDERSTVRA